MVAYPEVYALNSPTQFITPIPTGDERDPTDTDAVKFVTGQVWLNKSSKNLFMNNGDSFVPIALSSTGDVVGPGSSTNTAIPTFKQTTGKIIQNSLATLDSDGNLTSPTLNALSSSATLNDVALNTTTSTTATGTPVAGFGTGMLFQADNAVNALTPVATINAVYSSPTSGAEDAYLTFRTAFAGLAGGLGESFRVGSSGISTNGSNYFRYIEGTWTPSLSRSGITYAYTTQQGVYSKIGNIVHFAGEVVLTSATGTGSGNLFLNGLPFATKNVAGLQQYFTIAINNVPTTGSLWVARSIANTNIVGLGLYAIDTATTTLAVDVGGTSIIFISGTYLSV